MSPGRADDPLAPRVLTFRQHGVGVELLAGHGTFSTAAVDPGTRFLLRWLATAPYALGAGRVLDLGCGYGPLGLWLAAADPERRVVAVDRDAVAVACAAEGAERNGLAGAVRAHASLGYDDLEGDDRFDLVVSNVPAKVGPAALRHLLLDAWHHLAPGGAVAVVVIDRLVAPVRELLAAAPSVELLDDHANRGYAALTWRFRAQPSGSDPAPGFARGVYGRGRGTFGAAGLAWEAATSFTLPEFDTLGHATVAAAELLAARRGLPGPVAVVGAGQGHTALALRAAAGEGVALRLVDRDLLALRTAAANLGGDGVEVHHRGEPAGALEGCASAVVALPEKQPVAVGAALLAPAVAALGPGAPILLHGRSADVARVLDVLGRRGGRFEIDGTAGQKGHRAVVGRFTVTPPA